MAHTCRPGGPAARALPRWTNSTHTQGLPWPTRRESLWAPVSLRLAAPASSKRNTAVSLRGAPGVDEQEVWSSRTRRRPHRPGSKSDSTFKRGARTSSGALTPARAVRAPALAAASRCLAAFGRRARASSMSDSSASDTTGPSFGFSACARGRRDSSGGCRIQPSRTSGPAGCASGHRRPIGTPGCHTP